MQARDAVQGSTELEVTIVPNASDPALTRRALLLGAGAVATTRRPRAQTPLRVVVVGGHPGDPEYGCGGTVARYTSLGHIVTLLYLNPGQGPNDGAPECHEIGPGSESAVRVQEAANAARILGAQTYFLDQCNGQAIVDLPHYEATAEVIKALAPDVIFDQWPIDNHPDHRAISSLAYEAWLRLGRQAAFYYYEVSDGEDTEMFAPTDYVDITAVEPRKRAACYAHASQSPDRYYELQTTVSRFRGLAAGCEQAEAFVRHARSRLGLLP